LINPTAASTFAVGFASLMSLISAVKSGLICSLKPGYLGLIRAQQLLSFVILFFLQYPGKKGDVYNILWVLVFGFATLNILGLVARKFEPDRSRMNFGEILAVLVVLISVALLCWELLNILHIFPIKLKPR
jgi:hypothetical protein